MGSHAVPVIAEGKPNYGIDAPGVLRNLFLGGLACVLLALLLPSVVEVGHVSVRSQGFFWPGAVMLAEAGLFLLYVKVGKFRHRDFMLAMHSWGGAEQVLDVGCGRGLLLAGAARRIAACNGSGRAFGIDIWSSVDMGGNTPQATLHNLQLEGIADRCQLISVPAQEMPFPDASFDLVVSNLCLHNIESRTVRNATLAQIARVLRPGCVALISDYKHTAQYAEEFRKAGLQVERRWGNPVLTFPPLRVVIARRPVV